MIDRNNIIEILRLHRSELEGFGVKHLSLFGSTARLEASAASDIDIGVAFNEDVRPEDFSYFGVRQRLEDKLQDLLHTKIELSDEAMMRVPVKETYTQDRIYAF